MKIELICRACHTHFTAPPETPEDDVIQRMTEEGPWFALAAGGCFRDMIHTALQRRGGIACPECGVLVHIVEVSEVLV
ncbi:MAG TPA: hypothetical protein VE999_01545 [Gemmataceae bacterium]|nr:hypothetical protein [Gemmataceae bacterium]